LPCLQYRAVRTHKETPRGQPLDTYTLQPMLRWVVTVMSTLMIYVVAMLILAIVIKYTD
jgi:hypothetical protein